MLTRMSVAWSRFQQASVRLRVLTSRPAEGKTPTCGMTVPITVLEALGWESGDEILMKVTGSGRLLVERIEPYD